MSKKKKFKQRIERFEPNEVEVADAEELSLFGDRLDDTAPPQDPADVEAKRVEEQLALADAEKMKMLVPVKVDGVRTEVPLEEVVRAYQKASSSDKRFREAAELRKQVEQFMASLTEDPWSLFAVLGRDPDRDAEERVWRRMNESRMEPWEREEMQRRRAKSSEREARERWMKDRAQAAERSRYEGVVRHYEPLLNEALDVHGLPDTEVAVARAIEALLDAVEDGKEPTADGLARDVTEALGKEYASSLGAMSPEVIEKLAGEGFLSKVTEHARSKLPPDKRPKLAMPSRRTEGESKRDTGKETRGAFTSDDDFNAALRAFVRKERR